MRQILILFVRAYQVALSPLFSGCCRFEPSCSQYAIEALKVHGAWRGGWLTLKRLLRCRPFGPSGYDPVPCAPAAGRRCAAEEEKESTENE